VLAAGHGQGQGEGVQDDVGGYFPGTLMASFELPPATQVR